jgi:hypothetical protein
MWCCGGTPSENERPSEEEGLEVDFAMAKLAKTCIQALLVDALDPDLLYVGAWDGSVRSYALLKAGGGELACEYFGCQAAVEGLAQCRPDDGVDLLFAVPSGRPGVVCWRKTERKPACVFTTLSGAFSATSVFATPSALYCGHATAGVVRWALDADLLSYQAGGLRKDAVPLELGGELETARGPVAAVSSVRATSCAYQPASSSSPSEGSSDSGGGRLLTGHAAPLAELLHSSNALAAAPHAQMATYGCLVFDLNVGRVVGALAYKHRAVVSAVGWAGPDLAITADTHGLAVEWRVSTAVPLRMFASEQGACRALLVIADTPWPAPPASARSASLSTRSASFSARSASVWSGGTTPAGTARSGASDRSEGGAPPVVEMLLTGSDRGAPIIAHLLAGELPTSAPITTTVPRAPPSTPGTPGTGSSRRRAHIPAGARGSLYSLAHTTNRRYLSGHLSGEVFVWSDHALLGSIAPPDQDRGSGPEQMLRVTEGAEEHGHGPRGGAHGADQRMRPSEPRMNTSSCHDSATSDGSGFTFAVPGGVGGFMFGVPGGHGSRGYAGRSSNNINGGRKQFV